MSLSPRLRRTLELVYAVDGVAAARVWQWPGQVAVGVRPSPLVGAADLLRRVEHAVSGVREQDETWHFGVLDLDAPERDDEPEPETPGLVTRRPNDAG